MAVTRLAPVAVAFLVACLCLNLTYGKFVFVGGRFENSPGSSGDFRASTVWTQDERSFAEVGSVTSEAGFVRTSRYDHYAKRVFVGGNFTRIGERPSVPLVASNTSNYASLDVTITRWNITTQSGSSIPLDIASNGQYVYVATTGGRFAGRDNAVLLEGLVDTWSTVPANDNLNGRLTAADQVFALAYWNNGTIVGGRSTLATTGNNIVLGGLGYIKTLPSSSDSSFTRLGNGICDGLIRDMIVINNILYIGGNFTAVNASDCASPDAVDANGFAAFNLTSNEWYLPGGVLFPANSDIYSLASHNDFNVTYYAASNSSNSTESATPPVFPVDPTVTNKLPLLVVGRFSGLGGSINTMAKFDGVAWSNLTSVPLNATGNVYAVAEVGGDYLIGGDFVNQEASISCIARWQSNTSTWDNMIGGLTCKADSAFCAGNSPVVWTLSTFPELSEIVPARSPSIFDFFDWQGWSIVLAGCVVLAMIMSIIVNLCFKCCPCCKK